MFTELGDYRDSKILADETWKHYAKELERAELAKKQAEERAAAINGVIFVLVVALIILTPMISFFFKL